MSLFNSCWLLVIKIILVHSIPLSPGILNSFPITKTQRTVCDAPEKLSYIIKESELNCPCQHIGEVANNLNQLVYENILNNPTVQGIISPVAQNEIQLYEKVPNNSPASSTPSVINNYIIIPPEAFKNKPKCITKRNSEPKKRKRRRKTSEIAGTVDSKPKHDNIVTEKTPKRKEKSKPKVDEQRHQISIPKNNEGLRNHQIPQNTNCPRNEHTFPTYCDLLDVLKEYQCCPENRQPRNSDKNTQPANQLQLQSSPNPQVSKKPEAPKNLQINRQENPNTSTFQGTPQMPFPNFAPYFANPGYFFNHPQMFQNGQNALKPKTKSTTKVKPSNNIQTNQTNQTTKTLQPQQGLTNTKSKTNNRNQKQSPRTVILNIKIDDGSNKKNGTTINLDDKKVENSNLVTNLNKTEVVELTPAVNQSQINDNNSDIKNFTTTESPITETTTEILEITSTTFNPAETVELLNSTEIIESTTVLEKYRNPIESDNKENSAPKMLAKYEEKIDTLGSEDELPNIEANDLMEDYYPDFHKDNKAYLERSILNKEKTKKHIVDVKIGLQEIPRVLVKNRHYYEIQREESLENDEPEKIFLPKSLVTTTTIKTLDDSRTSTISKNNPEKADFITPPTLSNIDFETKQINSKKNPTPLDEDYEDLSPSKPEVFYKGSAYSVTKTPQYTVKLKPNEELKLKIVPEEYSRKGNIETVFANSKVVNYGASQDSTEDTVERPLEEEYSEEKENNSKSDGPFLVIAKSIGNEEELW